MCWVNCDAPRTAGEKNPISRPPEPEPGGCPLNQLVTKNLFSMDMATVYIVVFSVYTTCSTHGNIP